MDWETFYSFMKGGPYHVENNSLICSVNYWTGFYMIGASFMKELINLMR